MSNTEKVPKLIEYVSGEADVNETEITMSQRGKVEVKGPSFGVRLPG